MSRDIVIVTRDSDGTVKVAARLVGEQTDEDNTILNILFDGIDHFANTADNTKVGGVG